MNSSYADTIEYGMFLLEEQTEKLKLKAFIDECIIRETSSDIFKDMQVLNEGFVDKIKELIGKLGNLIMNTWKKFINNMDILFKNDKKYLEKYKDIILKKKLKEDTYTMYDYPLAIRRLINSPIPQIQINNANFIENGQDEDKFIKANNFNKYTKKYHDDETFKDQVKNFARGESEIEIPSGKINMADMYQYCIDFNKMKTRMDSDLKILKSSYDVCLKSITELGGTATTNESYNIFYNSNRSYYSFIKESVIYEDGENNDAYLSTEHMKNVAAKMRQQSKEIQDAKKNKSSDKKDEDAKSDEKDEDTGTETAHQHNKNIDTSKDADKKVNDENKEDKEKLNKMYTAVQTYYKVSSQFLSAKMEIFHDCYTFYMKFIRNHVKNYVGNKGKEEIGEDRGKQVNTDYSDKKNNPFDNKDLNNTKEEDNKSEEKENNSDENK